MSSLPRPDIVGLDWDEQNERHVEEHIGPWLIEEMIEGGDWFAFPNSDDHPPNRWKFVGRAPGGLFVTAILRKPRATDPGVWRPITGWMATDQEQAMYRAAQRQRRKG